MTEYIEREKIYQIAKNVVDAIASGNYYPGVFAYDILDWIDDLPAADVRPVVRGEWKSNVPPRDLRPRCSVCGELQPQKTNFCHNCGADMREEDDGT